MAVTYPTTNRERANLYVNALNEIRVRLRSIDGILAAPIAELVQAESCQLQLRLAAECLAVACLAAQGDFETHRAFREEYNPVAIFKALEATYPAFFPIPSAMLKTNHGWHFDDVGAGHAIDRGEIEALWSKSGDHLHRTSAKKYLKRTNKVDFLAITKAKERFWNLIQGHMIIFADHEMRFHARLERDSEMMECIYFYLDVETGTAKIEPYRLEA